LTNTRPNKPLLFDAEPKLVAGATNTFISHAGKEVLSQSVVLVGRQERENEGLATLFEIFYPRKKQ